MMALRYAIIAALAFGGGWGLRQSLIVQNDIEAELMANEEICASDTPKGMVAYPVTKYGEIRGCLRVRENSKDWTLPKHLFVRKGKIP